MTTETPPAPPAVSQDDFRAYITQNSATLEQLAESMRVLAAATAAGQRMPAPAAPGIPDVTDDEINQAIIRGEAAAPLIRRAAKAETDRAVRALREELGSLQQTHSSALQNLSAEVVLTKLPYYPKYKKEIDAQLATVQPHLRTDPAIIRRVYEMAVGAHAEELVSEAKEQAVRASREAPPAVTAGAATGRQVASGGAVQPEDVFDAATQKAARELGGYEKIAAMQGYRKEDGTGDVDAWMKTVQAYGGVQ